MCVNSKKKKNKSRSLRWALSVRVRPRTHTHRLIRFKFPLLTLTDKYLNSKEWNNNNNLSLCCRSLPVGPNRRRSVKWMDVSRVQTSTRNFVPEIKIKNKYSHGPSDEFIRMLAQYTVAFKCRTLYWANIKHTVRWSSHRSHTDTVNANESKTNRALVVGYSILNPFIIYYYDFYIEVQVMNCG